jgi:hypothetical protein
MPTCLIGSQCGADGAKSCDCGAPYVSPGECVLAASEEKPSLSNYAIAKRAGCDVASVRRARKKPGSTYVDLRSISAKTAYRAPSSRFGMCRR